MAKNYIIYNNKNSYEDFGLFTVRTRFVNRKYKESFRIFLFPVEYFFERCG